MMMFQATGDLRKVSLWLGHAPDFRPIPVEGPPIAPVPRDLRAYQFNDDLLGLIRAAELEMQARENVKSKFRKALPLLQKSAEVGDARAMYYLGQVYDRGRGVVQDYAKAREWYQKAAAASNIAAMNRLGELYEHGTYYHGRRFDEDCAKACEYYQRAAASGNANAMYRVGLLYKKEGLGLEQDYAQARQ
jgi:TPR repeat protein